MAIDWDNMAPGQEALTALQAVESEDELPHTYSGAAWRAAYRMWLAVKDDPAILDTLGPFDDVPGCDLKGLGLTGFMFGWAKNAVRHMLGRKPGANPAILTIDENGGRHETEPIVGTAEDAMIKAIGG